MKSFLGFHKEHNMSLFTDYYELTMCASYFDNKKSEIATFDLFIRNMPKNRSYFLFVGLEQVLLYLQKLQFKNEQLVYLKKQGFSDDFIEYLKNFEFTGDVWALPEGTVTFPNEPLIRITAPIIEAQIIETFLINTVNLQTMIATKASRVVTAAKGRPVIEFGLRREHGIDAGIKVARSSYIAGCKGTSNVLAGKYYKIPIFGTMAHSFIMSYENEFNAFQAFTKTFPNKTTLLIDTYDISSGLNNAILVAKNLEKSGLKLGGIRLDSGDLENTSKKIREILGKKNLDYLNIFASGDLDEFLIQKLLNNSAKIDAFGVGTKLGTSSDRPYLDIIYKLSEITDEKGISSPIMKLSKNKLTLPGKKQIFRCSDKEGFFSHDIIALEEEKLPGECLLIKTMEQGKLIYHMPSLENIRAYAKENLKKLPSKYHTFTNAPKYPVKLSEKLDKLTKNLRKKILEKIQKNCESQILHQK